MLGIETKLIEIKTLLNKGIEILNYSDGAYRIKDACSKFLNADNDLQKILDCLEQERLKAEAYQKKCSVKIIETKEYIQSWKDNPKDMGS